MIANIPALSKDLLTASAHTTNVLFYRSWGGGGSLEKATLFVYKEYFEANTREQQTHGEGRRKPPQVLVRFKFESNKMAHTWCVWVCVNGFGKVSTALLLRNIHLSLASNSQAMERGKKRERKQTILIHIFWLGFSATSAEGTFSRSPFNGCVLSNNTIRS